MRALMIDRNSKRNSEYLICLAFVECNYLKSFVLVNGLNDDVIGVCKRA